MLNTIIDRGRTYNARFGDTLFQGFGPHSQIMSYASRWSCFGLLVC